MPEVEAEAEEEEKEVEDEERNDEEEEDEDGKVEEEVVIDLSLLEGAECSFSFLSRTFSAPSPSTLPVLKRAFS